MVTTHVLVGALTGAALLRRGHRALALPAFVLGVASHFALDAVPHWGAVPSEVFLRVAVIDGLIALLVVSFVVVTIAHRGRVRIVAGMLGAALPDLDKPSRLLLGESPFPPWFDAFHGGIQQEAPDRMALEMLVAVGLGAVLALVARRTSADAPSDSDG